MPSPKKPTLPKELFALMLVGPGPEGEVGTQVLVGVFLTPEGALSFAASHPPPGDVYNLDEDHPDENRDLYDALINQGHDWQGHPSSHRRPFGYRVIELANGRPNQYADVVPFTQYNPVSAQKAAAKIDPAQELDWM